MWKMTLKQRRRHGELVAEFDRIKKNPYINVPEDYEFGRDEEEDNKYEGAIRELNRVLKEMHDIEQAARDAT